MSVLRTAVYILLDVWVVVGGLFVLAAFVGSVADWRRTKFAARTTRRALHSVPAPTAE